MLRSKSAHRCKSNPRTDQCYSKNSASAHSRITAPAIACPHLRKKKVSLFIKFKPSETADTQASIAAKVDAENAATTAQTPSQFPSEAGTITRGASISHGPSVKIKNNVQKLALSDNPPIFLRPNRLRSNAFSPAPISKRAIREKSTLLQTQETPISLCPRAQRREKKPPPHPHQMRFPSPQPRLMKANAPCLRQPQTQESSEDPTRATFQSRQTASSAPDSPPYAPHQTPPQSPPKPIFRRYLPYHNLFAKCAQ